MVLLAYCVFRPDGNLSHEHAAADGERALRRVHGDAALVLGEFTAHEPHHALRERGDHLAAVLLWVVDEFVDDEV